MKLQQYIASSILVGSALIGSPVLAQTVRGSNTDTGSSSINRIEIVEETDVVTIQSTTTQSTNSFSLDLKTGGNKANTNAGNGEARSGSIDVTLKQQDQTVSDPQVTTLTSQSGSVNSLSQSMTVQSSSQNVKTTSANVGPEIIVSNQNTGAQSENIVDIRLTKTTVAQETQTRVEENIMNLAFNTGDNEANGNTGSGVAEGGSITLKLVKESLSAPKPKLPTPPVPPAPTQPTPTVQPSQPSPTAPSQLVTPAQPTQVQQPTTVPTPLQELKPIMAEKLAQLAPSQPTQFITPAAQPTPAVPVPEKKLPKAGAETPILATMFSLGVMRYRQYRKRRRFELLYRHKKPW